MAITFTPGLAGMSAQDKAAEYNTLVNSGFSDADIKAAADAIFGVQPAEDWAYLTNLASSLPPVTGALSAANSGNISGDLASSNAGPTVGALAAANIPTISADDRQQDFIDSNTTRPNFGRTQAEVDAEAALAYAEQQRVAAANVTDLGNGYVQIADGRIFDSQGTQVSSVPSATTSVTGAAGNDNVTGASGASTTTAADATVASNTSTAATTLQNWPTVDWGSAGDDLEIGRKGSASDGTPLYLNDGDGGGSYRNPDLLETYSYVAGPDGKRYVAVHAPVFSTGVEPYEAPITSYMTEEQYKALKGPGAFAGLINSPVGQFGLALLGPYGQAFNSLYQASTGNTTGAILSGLNAYGSFAGADAAALQAAGASGDAINASQLLDLQNSAANARLASTVIGGLDAASRGNIAGVINAGVSGAGQAGVTLPSGLTTAVQLANVATAFQDGNGSSFLNALGDLAGSSDLKTAAAAANLLQIATGKNPNLGAIYGAVQNLTSAASASTAASTTTGNAGSAAFVAAKNAGASDADALAASNALTTIANANETFDGSSFDTQNAAMNAAIEDGKDKFTFGGKTFTIDNSAAQIKDFEDTVAAETAARAASTTEFGDLTGAINSATARNTVAIGNAEADNPEEAAYLARLRDPSASNFTFGGKTYTMTASDAAMNAAVRADELNIIQNNPNFNAAYAAARDLLGPGQTFPWFNPKTGKVESFSTATAAERTDLTGIPPVAAATDQSAAETARLAALNNSLVTGNAPNQTAAETARLAAFNNSLKANESTSFLQNIYKYLNEQFRLQGVAANEYLANNPNSPITNNISTALEAVGTLQKDVFGGGALLLGNKPLSDLLVKGGNDLTKLGQNLGTGPQDTQNWEDTVELISKAKGLEKLGVLAGRFMDGTSGLGRQVEVNLRQELPGLFLGAGGLRATLVAGGLMNVGETAGNAALDAYEEDIKEGKSHATAMSSARAAGGTAAMTEAAIQLTLGKLADFGVGKIGNVAGKAGTKVIGEGAIEGGQEGGAALAVDLVLDNDLNANKYLTQTVVGGAVGKGAATTTAGVDIAQSDTLNQATSGATTAASNGTNLGAVGATRPGVSTVTGTDLGPIGVVTPGGDTVVSGAGTITGTGATTGAQTTISVDDAQTVMGDLGLNVSNETAVDLATKINNASSTANTTNIANNVTTQIGSGADASVVVGNTVTGAINLGSNANSVITSTVTSSINAGANASTVVGSAVTSAVTAGANVDTSVASSVSASIAAGTNASTAVTAATDAAIAAGNNVTVATGASTTTVTNATTNTTTTVNNATGVATTVDGNTNVTTTLDAATGTTTVVDPNTSTTSQTTTDANTQTTVVTNVNTNTQVTVKVNTDTGEIIDETETVIPDTWTPPVIDSPETPTTSTATATSTPVTTPATTPTKTAATAKLGNSGADTALASGAMGLPSVFDTKPASLGSQVTQGRIDPLARVKEAQAELERDIMMSQIDPRLMSVMQQRMDPYQQSKQLEQDTGALAKMLRGDSPDPSAPSPSANEGKYYSYGAEDSIDDILGGKASNYKAGGYVEPLKASGGMVLPLLAKSGGALGKYNGREDFKNGKHVAGEGDGQSDDIPAWLADGEFVFSSDVVAALGNGSTKAGTDKLYEMMHEIRKRARSTGPKNLPPPALKSPLDYLKKSNKK